MLHIFFLFNRNSKICSCSSLRGQIQEKEKKGKEYFFSTHAYVKQAIILVVEVLSREELVKKQKSTKLHFTEALFQPDILLGQSLLTCWELFFKVCLHTALKLLLLMRKVSLEMAKALALQVLQYSIFRFLFGGLNQVFPKSLQSSTGINKTCFATATTTVAIQISSIKK